MPSTDRTLVQFKFTDEDLAMIDRAKELARPQLLGREPTRADAVRLALRTLLALAAKNPKKIPR